jgi:hypothetical protein
MIDLFPFIGDTKPVQEPNLGELALNRWWRAQLAVTGAEGLPAPSDAGNVLRPTTKLVLSLRLPPTLPTAEAEPILTELFEKDPPYGAQVTWKMQKSGGGWAAPPLAPWLETAAEKWVCSTCVSVVNWFEKACLFYFACIQWQRCSLHLYTHKHTLTWNVYAETIQIYPYKHRYIHT